MLRQASFPSTTVSGSVPLSVLLGPSAKACFEGQSRAACNAVANLCVLQLYKGCEGFSIEEGRTYVLVISLGGEMSQGCKYMGFFPRQHCVRLDLWSGNIRALPASLQISGQDTPACCPISLAVLVGGWELTFPYLTCSCFHLSSLHLQRCSSMHVVQEPGHTAC